MIGMPHGARIWLACGATDMRRGFDGLAAMVQTQLAADPYAGHLFVFRGRRGNRLKILWYSGDGMCLLSKRLDGGRFVWPQTTTGTIALSSAELSMLLEGIDWRRARRTTLMQWVGASSELLGPLAAALGRHVLAAPNINADDTPIKVLAPGTGRAKKGRLWTYVRDGRGWGSTDPPAVWYRYSSSWHGKYPQQHLAGFEGKLQVDAYAGFEPLFVPSKPGVAARILEIACWAHVRRKWFDLYEAHASPLAREALDRIGQLYKIETAIRGQSAVKRRAARQQYAVPLLAALQAWMIEQSASVDQGSTFATAFNYAFNNWEALQRYAEDGHLEIDNNIAERSVRGAGVGRKNYLFFGSDTGGDRAAIIYSLMETCKLNHIDPQRYLHYVLERIADHPINRIEELLPWNLVNQLQQPAQVTHALAA